MVIYEEALKKMNQGEAFVYGQIVTQRGSSPRDSGASMLIGMEDIVSTIGGGFFENKIIQQSRETLIPERQSDMVYIDMTGKSEENPMICGGNIDILLSYIDPADERAREFFLKAAELYHERKEGVLLWGYHQGQSVPQAGTSRDMAQVKKLMKRKREIHEISPRTLSQEERDALQDILGLQPATSEGSIRFFAEIIQVPPRVVVFGGGHVSFETVKLLNLLDYDTLVVDDREEFASPDRFPGSEVVIMDWNRIQNLEIQPEDFVLIITRGHSNDKDALKAALEKHPRYIGMIGSVRKRDVLYKELNKEGIPMETLSQVHCPVGLEIGADTPMEIAVSIVAEIIQVIKNQENLL